MQNKGIIKFFAITFAVICLYQISFTFITRSVEKKAHRFANSEIVKSEAKTMSEGDQVREQIIFDSLSTNRYQHYIDSVGNDVAYNILIRKYTYKECKERELNLGLDLRGGMNVVMEVSTADVVDAMTGFSKDPMFRKVMDMAKQKHKTTPNSNFVTIFEETWNQVDPNAKMSTLFSYEMKSLKANATNSDVVKAIREETSSAFDRTYQILRQRIDKFGVTQPNVQKLSQSERILIELPGVKDPERVRKLLQGTAQLEFWETYEFSELIQNLKDANEYLAAYAKILGDTTVATTTETTVATTANDEFADLKVVDTAKKSEAEMTAEEWREKNPLFAVLMPTLGSEDRGDRKGPVVGYSLQKDIPIVNKYLEQAKSKFPRNVKFRWTVKTIAPKTDIYQLVALKITTRDGQAPMTGEVVTDARQDYSQNGGVEVSMTMNAEGAKTWKNMTGSNIGRSIAIVLDDYVYSFPTVNTEIGGGRSQITGGFSVEEGKDLANVLKAGKLPAPAKIVQEAVVGPSLGEASIKAGLISFILAFLMVLVYMLFFYNRAGIVANIALLINVFFLIGILTSLGAVLTLPGIAGIVLTMGMAVDANVIIYERIKEEIRAGKGLRLAINDGFKHAYSAILDSNFLSLMTGIVLYIFGTGPIQSFAFTFCIGIITSLFTAIFISRLIFNWMLDNNRKIDFDTKITRNFLHNVHLDFIGFRKYAYIISSVLIVVCVISFCTRGLSLGIDFSGGRTYVVRFDKDVNTNDVRESLTKAFGNDMPEVKTYGPSNQIKVTTKYMINETGPATDSTVESHLFDGCKDFFNKPITHEEFNSESDTKLLGKLSSEMVGATMASDITRAAFIAVAVALLFIFAYIAVRFKKWQYGLGALISLAHDSILTVGLFSLLHGLLPFSLDIDQAFIAAILTIIGYSIMDTVVIFDRVREYLRDTPNHNLKEVMNNAMNSTLGRTFNTAGSTFIVILMIFLFGGESIRGFMFALLVGVVVGTYSSVIIAVPTAYDAIVGKLKKKKDK